jgi:hypothetical protein
MGMVNLDGFVDITVGLNNNLNEEGRTYQVQAVQRQSL